jgi:hypothetical protein
MDSKRKGRIALLKVQLRAVERGCMTSVPSSDDCRYDLILDEEGVLRRAQVKWGGMVCSHAAGAVQVDLRKDDGKRGQKRRLYSADEIDVVLVYVPQVDRVAAFTSEHFAGKTALIVRLEPPKNGQQKNLRMLQDFLW